MLLTIQRRCIIQAYQQAGQVTAVPYPTMALATATPVIYTVWRTCCVTASGPGAAMMDTLLHNTLAITLAAAPWLLLGLLVAGAVRALIPEDQLQTWLKAV